MTEASNGTGGAPLCLIEHSYGVHPSFDPNSEFFAALAAELGFEPVVPVLTDLVPVEDEDPMLVIPSLSEQAARVRQALGGYRQGGDEVDHTGNAPPLVRQPAVVVADSQGLLVHGMVGRTHADEQLIALAPPLYGSVLDRVLKPLDRSGRSQGPGYQTAAEPYGGVFGVTKVPGICNVVVTNGYIEEIAAIEGAEDLQVPAPEEGALWPIGVYAAMILEEYDDSVIAPVVMLPNPDNRLDTEGQLASLAVLEELLPNISAERVDDAGGHRFMNSCGRAAIKYALARARVLVSETALPARTGSPGSAATALQD